MTGPAGSAGLEKGSEEDWRLEAEQQTSVGPEAPGGILSSHLDFPSCALGPG